MKRVYYYSTFGRKIVQQHQNVKHIHVVFDEIYSSESIQEDIFIPTRPGSRIYIKVNRVYIEFKDKPILEELDWTTFFVLPNEKPRGALWIWITSLSWTGFNNGSRNIAYVLII